MKKLLILFLISLTTNLFSQNTKEKVVPIHQPQSFRLVSATKSILGTESKIVLDVKLPRNTIRWYYTFSASRSKEQIKRTQATLNLAGQLTKIIDKTGTTAKALSLLTSPPGDNFCDVYLLSSYNEMQKFQKEFSLKTFSVVTNGSRKNYKSGTVEISNPDYCSGTQYIGIANQNGLYGVGVAIEVVAIVLEGWKAEDKQKLHDATTTLMISNGALDYFEEKEVNDLTTCILNKFTTKFTPQDLEHKANYEIESELELIAEKCAFEMGLDEKIFNEIIQPEGEATESNISKPSRQILIGTWRDDNSVFTLQNNGNFYIKWDNQQQVWGKWKFENGLFYVQLGKGQKFIPQKFITFSKDEFKFQAVGEAKVYTARRIK